MIKKIYISLGLIAVILLFYYIYQVSEKGKSNFYADKIWEQYEVYKEPLIASKLIKHADVVFLINKHTQNGIFKNEILGTSVEGRSIHHLTIGTGKIKVLLWSQMHGDESTATMALFDIFNFLEANDENNDFRNYLLNNLELHFVPMLNPDGAQVWKRRNALDIDLNRDALALVSPEANMLKNIVQQLKPDYGFNLHDQSTLYSVGDSKEEATISFLAPAYDMEKSENEVRTNAMKLIVKMNTALQKHIPGKVAKYSDDHEPRAFGDNIQKWGVSTVLVESGGFKNDFEKQYMRKLNFYALLYAFETICNKSHETEKTKNYYAIPENTRFNFDLVVRNVAFNKNGKTYITNIGINQAQISNADFSSFYFKGSIAEIGDTQRNFGYEDQDAGGRLLYTVPKIKLMKQKAWENLKPNEELNLIKQGYLYVRFSDVKTPLGAQKNRLLNLTNQLEINNLTPQIGSDANFILTKNNVSLFAVINGFWVDLSKEVQPLPNTIGY